MTKKLIQKPLAAAMGAAFLTSVSAVSIVEANENPFTATQLSSGYTQLAAMDGNCGGKKMKEGNCGGDKLKAKCAEHKKMKDGKCGTGKCGANKKKCDELNKMKDGNCGAKKMKDGNCGAKK